MENLYLFLLARLIRLKYWCESLLENLPHHKQRKPFLFDPISGFLITFAISAAASAASFGASLLVNKLLAPKRKPEVKGKLTGEITLTDSIWGAFLLKIFGAAPGDGDNFGGMEVGCNIFWASAIRKIQTTVPGGSGGGGNGGKGSNGGGNTPSTIQINYKIDLAAAVGEGRLRLLRLKFNEDTVYGGVPTGGGETGTRYEAESSVNARTGTAIVANDNDCSNDKKVTGIGPNGTLTFNFDSSFVTTPIDPDPPDPDPIPFHFIYISYKSDGDRQAYVQLNGSGGIYTFPDTGGAVGSRFISRRYFEPAATLEISNPNAEAPEIDCIDISVETLYEDYRASGIRDLAFPPDAAQDNLLPPNPLDPDTNAAERFNAPVAVGSEGVMEITLANGASLAWYDGGEDQPIDPVIAAALGAASTPAFRGTAYGRISNLDFSKYGTVPNMRWLVENIDTRTVAEICTSLAESVGLEADDLDFAEAADRNVRGYVIDSVQPPIKTFEELGLIHNLSFAENSDGRIAARDLSNRAAVAQIRAHDLKAYVDDGETESPTDDVVQTILDESTDLARELELQFYNPLPPVDYGTDRAKFIYPYTASRRTETRSVNALLTKEEALAVTRRELQKNHLKVAPVAFNLPYKFAALEAGDCFDIEIENAFQRFRLEEKTGAAPGVFECSATNENIIAEASETLEADDAPVKTIAVAPKARTNYPAGTFGTILDLPPLEEAQVGKYGVYVAACPRARGGAWDSATVYRLKGSDYQQMKILTKPAIIGRVVGTFGGVPEDITGDLDGVSSFTVDFFGDENPTSVTEEQQLDGAGAAVVGSEVLTVQTWTRENDHPNRWTATKIVRRQRNTGKFADAHVAGERVVLLTDAVKFIPLEREEVGVERTWKFVTAGAEINDAGPVDYTWAGENLVQGRNLVAAQDRNLTAADAGKMLTNEGASDLVTYLLPPPVEESEYRFAVVFAVGLRVKAPSGYTIRFASAQSGSDGYVRSFAVGSTLTVRVVAGEWMMTHAEGEWEVD